MKQLILQRAAEAEFEEAVAFYERRRAGLGGEFREAVMESIARIRRHPQRFARYKRSPYRSCLVKRFPYVIYFGETDDRIWVMAVAHGRRRPDYWRRRKLI
ncbi:MAG: type II toxin-antitoxin system RelE/ParE family toxin [Pirellulales bacterium]